MNGTMSLSPLVSVIIPNYNHAPYLKQRIDSVLQQTFQDFEVIILDDKSTDNSKDVIESYRNHEKISHIVYNEQNSGSTFKQWKKGLDLSKGQWIWIAESDDVAELDFLKKLTAKIESTTSLIFCASNIIDEHGKLSSYLGSKHFPNPAFFNKLKFLPEQPNKISFLTEEMYNFNHIVNASSVLFKKSYTPDLISISNQYKLCGDWIFWIKLIEQGDFLYVNEGLNNFRTHSSTVRNNSDNKIFAYFENAQITNYLFEQYGSKALNKIYADYLIYIYFNRYSKEIRKGTFLKFLKTIRRFGVLQILNSIKIKLTND
jgi:glycosyltransferase involved in cell wall biosynthesis